jgi:hypothetical protein
MKSGKKPAPGEIYDRYDGRAGTANKERVSRHAASKHGVEIYIGNFGGKPFEKPCNGKPLKYGDANPGKGNKPADVKGHGTAKDWQNVTEFAAGHGDAGGKLGITCADAGDDYAAADKA